MQPIEITFFGVFLATVFAITMGGLLWWMLHPPAAIGQAVAKAHRSVDAIKRILVPTSGMVYSERGVELACRLGFDQKAEIILTYVIEVPRTLPLNAPLADAEAKAREALDRAQQIVLLHELEPTPLVERAREASEGIIRAAKDHQVDLIVLGMRTSLATTQTLFGRTTEILVKRAPCEVIIDKLPV